MGGIREMLERMTVKELAEGASLEDAISFFERRANKIAAQAPNLPQLRHLIT